MSEGGFDAKGCFAVVIAMLAVLLAFYVVIDMYAGWRDMHHIRDLQRRVGELEMRQQ